MLKDLVIGSNIWFARLGSTVASATVVSTALPVWSSSKADWTKLGSVTHWEPKTNITWVDLRAAPSTKGKYQLRKRLPLNSRLIHNFALQEFEKLEFELLLNAATIDASTGVYVPNSRGGTLEGWLHLDCYQQDDVKILDEDSWVQLSMDSYQFAEKLEPHALVAEVLLNSLNHGTLSGMTS